MDLVYNDRDGSDDGESFGAEEGLSDGSVEDTDEGSYISSKMVA